MADDPRPDEGEDGNVPNPFSAFPMFGDIARALQGKPSVDEVLQKYKSARHPFASGAEG